MRKKKVAIASNYCKKNTGFAKAKRNLLLYLHKTGKYEIVELCNGFPKGDDSHYSTPWRCVGTMPDNSGMTKIEPGTEQLAGYGHYTIDKIIEEEKPDVYIGIEDIWAFKLFELKPWWKKLTPVVWTTLDSLPLLPESIDLAAATPHYFVWAEFAEKELHRLGCKNVKTLHGPIDLDNFKPLPEKEREALRLKFGLKDKFVIGFVFRNQLRKSVPNLMKGFAKFKAQNPKSNALLYLHTYWQEGWDIKRLALENEIPMTDIITTYFCSQCSEYFVENYQGEGCACPSCKAPALNTTNIVKGVDESQLNEVYNLMDVYCHPFTSGGQEIPIQEAKLSGLITLVTNYSCGEEYCTDESGGLSLAWDEYREPGSQFIKASTKSESIAYALNKVFKMDPEKRKAIGKKARDWVLNEFGVEKTGKCFEGIIDSAPFVDEAPEVQETPRNVDYMPPEDLSNADWVDAILKNMLNRPFDHKHREAGKILEALELGRPREAMLNILKENARRENAALAPKVSFDSLLDENLNGRVAIILPQGKEDVFFASALLEDIKGRYPDKDLYFITHQENFEILIGNPYIHKLIAYHPGIDNPGYLEGIGPHKGHFDVAYRLHGMTQKDNLYTHNGVDVLGLDLN